MSTIVPLLRASMAGSRVRVSRIGVCRSRRSISSQRAISVWSVGPTTCTPALLTSTSMGPRAASAGAIQSQARSTSPRSAAMTNVFPVDDAAIASSFSLRRAIRDSFAPLAENSRAIASPIPADAPVTATCMLLAPSRRASYTKRSRSSGSLHTSAQGRACVRHRGYAHRPVNLEFFDVFPVLTSERLLLRELCEDDAAALFEVLRDDEVTRYYDVETMTDVTAAAALIEHMRQR